MKIISEKLFVSFLFLSIFFVPVFVFAHQPRIVVGTKVNISDPEISKAYYGQLNGEPHFFEIASDKKFVLYLNILVPDIEGQKKDLSFSIIKNGNVVHPTAILDGIDFSWKPFWEEFGRDNYFQGPEYRAYAEPGDYEIRVWSSNNDSKYSLAVGGTETVNFKEAINGLLLIPQVKRDFFGESPVGFILSPFGYGYIVIMYALAFVFCLIIRFIHRRLNRKEGENDMEIKSTPPPTVDNANFKDHFFLYFVGGVVLILFAIYTTWNPLIIFASGVSFFMAIFNPSGIYSIFDKGI